MEENVVEMLVTLASVLHWMGKYRECNVVTLLARMVKAYGIDTQEALERWVERTESKP